MARTDVLILTRDFELPPEPGGPALEPLVLSESEQSELQLSRAKALLIAARDLLVRRSEELSAAHREMAILQDRLAAAEQGQAASEARLVELGDALAATEQQLATADEELLHRPIWKKLLAI